MHLPVSGTCTSKSVFLSIASPPDPLSRLGIVLAFSTWDVTRKMLIWATKKNNANPNQRKRTVPRENTRLILNSTSVRLTVVVHRMRRGCFLKPEGILNKDIEISMVTCPQFQQVKVSRMIISNRFYYCSMKHTGSFRITFYKINTQTMNFAEKKDMWFSVKTHNPR